MGFENPTTSSRNEVLNDKHLSMNSNRSSASNLGNAVVTILPLCILFYLVFLLFLCLILRSWKKDAAPIPVQIARMTKEGRREYFKYLFQVNGSQIELQADQIQTIAHGKNETNTELQGDTATPSDGCESFEENVDLEHQEDVSIYLTLDNDDNDGDVNDGNNDNEPRCKIRGECAICLEGFEAGDMVVRSELRSCPHVYHKDCLVSYLVNRRRRGSSKNNERTPQCPTCRQEFCTLLAPPTPPKTAQTTPTTCCGAGACVSCWSYCCCCPGISNIRSIGTTTAT